MDSGGWLAAPSCRRRLGDRLARLDLTSPKRPGSVRANENQYHSRYFCLFQMIDAFQLHRVGFLPIQPK